MIFVRPMESWHINAFLENPREHDKALIGDIEETRTNLQNLAACTMGETFLTQDAEVVALWFVAQRSGGKTAVVFSYMTALVDRHPFEFMRACYRCIDVVHEALDVDRVEAFVDKGYRKSIKWLEKLGFKQEGPLKEHEIYTMSNIPLDMSAQVDKYLIMGRCW